MATAKYLDQALNDVEPLQAAFRVEDKRPERDYFVASCKACNQRWSLGVRNGRVHGGNVLALLDHATSHAKAAV